MPISAATDPDLAAVEQLLHRLYIAAAGATLRQEDRRKAAEIAALLPEIRRVMARSARQKPFVLVDAAAGKSYLGLLAAKLVLEPGERQASVITLEIDARRVAASRQAAVRLACRLPVDCRQTAVENPAAWPERPALVVALHACGSASDAIIERSIACGARALLLVPCCTGKSVAAAARARSRAETLGIPPTAGVRRRFIQAWVDAERTLRLEAAGYATEVVEFVAPTITPHNLLWRARYVGEPRHSQAAAARLERLVAP